MGPRWPRGGQLGEWWPRFWRRQMGDRDQHPQRLGFAVRGRPWAPLAGRQWARSRSRRILHGPAGPAELKLFLPGLHSVTHAGPRGQRVVPLAAAKQLILPERHEPLPELFTSVLLRNNPSKRLGFLQRPGLLRGPLLRPRNSVITQARAGRLWRSPHPSLALPEPGTQRGGGDLSKAIQETGGRAGNGPQRGNWLRNVS